MPIWRSITDANVDRFISLLEEAESDGDRARFRHLLVAEEDRYAQLGMEKHQREVLDLRIAAFGEKIARQETRMDGIRRNGGDLDQAELVMTNLTEIRATLTMVRTTLWPHADGL